MILGSGPGNQFSGLDVNRQTRVGYHRRKCRHQGTHNHITGVTGWAANPRDRIRLEIRLLLHRVGLLQLVDARLQPGVIGRGGHYHQVLAVGVHCNLSLGRQQLQTRHHAGRRPFGERIQHDLRRVRPRLGRLKLFEGLADHLLVGRHRQRYQVAGWRLDRKLRLRHHALQQRHSRRRIGPGDRMNLDYRRILGRIIAYQLGNGRLELLVILGGGPGDQFACCLVDREFCVGYKRRQRRHQRAHTAVTAATRRAADRLDAVCLEIGLLLHRGRLFELVDALLHQGMFRRRGRHRQVLAIGVHGESGVGDHRLQARNHAGRGRIGEGVDHQLPAARSLGCRLEFLQRGANHLLVLRNGQRHDAAALRVDRQLGLRNQLL